MGVSVLTLESQLGSHRCKWLHPQRKRRSFRVIWSEPKRASTGSLLSREAISRQFFAMSGACGAVWGVSGRRP